MRKIAIIGANEFQNPLILKAKEMGFETHVFAWQAGDKGERTADFFYPISIVEKDTILKKCREIGICAVTSIGSDLATHTVNYVSRALGFPCNSERCELVTTDKYEMRKAFLASGLPVPKFVEAGRDFSPDIVRDFSYPLIVKPTDRSGSRGIMKVESPQDLPLAVETSRTQAFSQRAIVEEFIEGPEYSAESISFRGQPHLLALTKKYTTEAPHFIETGHMEPSDIPDRLHPSIWETLSKALDALGIEYGASHAEFRLQPDGSIRLIEIGARMGGDCIGSDLVRISTGMDFTRMVIDVACGDEPDLKPVDKPRIAVVKFIFTQEDLAEMHRVQREAPESIWRISEIADISDRIVTDSSTRFGYFVTAS